MCQRAGRPAKSVIMDRADPSSRVPDPSCPIAYLSSPRASLQTVVLFLSWLGIIKTEIGTTANTHQDQQLVGNVREVHGV